MNKYSTYGAASLPQEAISLDKLIEAVDKIAKDASAANEWMLIGPGGQMWKTRKARELIQVLLPHAMKEEFE